MGSGHDFHLTLWWPENSCFSLNSSRLPGSTSAAVSSDLLPLQSRFSWDLISPENMSYYWSLVYIFLVCLTVLPCSKSVLRLQDIKRDISHPFQWDSETYIKLTLNATERLNVSPENLWTALTAWPHRNHLLLAKYLRRFSVLMILPSDCGDEDNQLCSRL